MFTMADPPPHEPLSRADLAGLSRAVLEATAAHRDEYQVNLAQARVEIRTEANNLGQILRNEMSHLRHDVLARVEGASRRWETMMRKRETRLLALVLASQAAMAALLAALQQAQG
jgi:hypothetical protein